MSDFAVAYAQLKDFEGGYANNPADRGGETYAGISRWFWPGWVGWDIVDDAKINGSFPLGPKHFDAYLVKIPALSAAVYEFYRANWWNRLGLSALPQPVADEIFEQSVNLGCGGTGKILQTVCNAYNFYKGKPLFDDLVIDGAVGPKTLTALELVMAKRCGAECLVLILNDMQSAHYIALASTSFEQRRFLDGWQKRIF